MSGVVSTQGRDVPFMPAEDKYELFRVRPEAGVTAISSLGVALTITGTATLRTPASTSWLDSQNRVGVVSAAGAGSVAGICDTVLMHFLGNASNRGGFLYICRFGLPAVVADERWFVGFRASAAAPTDVNPSTLTDIIGIGVDGTDANLQVMHNDAAGAATKVNLGASFPPRTAGVSYEIILECLRNATTVNYSVRRLDVVGTPARSTLVSNLPANTAFLGRYGYVANNATASAIALDLLSITSGNPMFESFL